MRGQWIGRYEGYEKEKLTQAGILVLNVDERSRTFKVAAYLVPDDITMYPPIVVVLETADKSASFKVKTSNILAVDNLTGRFADWGYLKSRYPGRELAESADIEGTFQENEVQIHSLSDLNVKFVGSAHKQPLRKKSSISGDIKTWHEFKLAVAEDQGKRFLFRGQQEPWPLRTAFHRKQRYSLLDFYQIDVPALHRYFSAKTSHVFDLQNDLQHAAFLSLAQHHGYPTPLMDWTYSPFVAAFFAFRNIAKRTVEEKVARVFVFDQADWRSDWESIKILDSATMHVTVLDVLAIENSRMIPQQAVVMATNIDDVEWYVEKKEEQKHGQGQQKQYLRAIDIPWSERDAVMKELAFMGITAGAMFPGLDGICEELREVHFDH